jgi:branched-chain amino acid transport system substrate-binding protein
MNTSRREWLAKAYGTLLLGGGIGGIGGISSSALAQTPRAAGAAVRGAARVVLLGQSVPLTGGANEIGSAFAAGSRLAVSDFNDRNAASGLQLKLLQLDDGYEAARATANARTLLTTHKADMLFGFVGTASSEAGANVATQQGSLLFAPFAASDNLRGADHPNVFHVRPGMIDEALKIVRQCATVGQTRVALVGDDDAMGRAGLAAVRAGHLRAEAARAGGHRAGAARAATSSAPR